MSVKDFGTTKRWMVAKMGGCWTVFPPSTITRAIGYHETFSEAHAAYLDAVTCEEVTPFLNYSDSRCGRSRGHKGPHWFATPVGLMPLMVNQK